MKKLIDKKIIISFLIGGLIFGSIGVFATTVISGTNISYDNTSSNLSSNNVQSAIDELNNKTNVGNAISDNISSGKTAMVNGALITGTGADISNAIKTQWESIANDNDLKARGYTGVTNLTTLKNAIDDENTSKYNEGYSKVFSDIVEDTSIGGINENGTYNDVTDLSSLKIAIGSGNSDASKFAILNYGGTISSISSYNINFSSYISQGYTKFIVLWTLVCGGTRTFPGISYSSSNCDTQETLLKRSFNGDGHEFDYLTQSIDYFTSKSSGSVQYYFSYTGNWQFCVLGAK